MADIPESTKLKACPFCGGPGHLQHSTFEIDAGWHVVCHGQKDCPLYCSEPYQVHGDEADAVTRWNTRAAPPAPIAEGVTCVAQPLSEDERKAAIDKWMAPPAMDREAVVQLKGDDQDPYSFSGDEDEDGFVISQHRFYKWGDDCVIAVGELNAPNTWDDEAFDAKCQMLVSTLSADAIRQGEGATARNCRVVGSDLWRHVKRGTVYEVLGTAELQAGQPQLEHAELVIYRGEDGKLWARNSGEFHDGRFVPATPASHASDGGKA